MTIQALRAGRIRDPKAAVFASVAAGAAGAVMGSVYLFGSRWGWIWDHLPQDVLLFPLFGILFGSWAAGLIAALLWLVPRSAARGSHVGAVTRSLAGIGLVVEACAAFVLGSGRSVLVLGIVAMPILAAAAAALHLLQSRWQRQRPRKLAA